MTTVAVQAAAVFVVGLFIGAALTLAILRGGQR